MAAILGLSPPGISTALTVLGFIVSEIQQVRASKKQLEVLSQAIGQLLGALDSEFKKSRFLAINVAKPLQDLKMLLDDVHRFVHKESKTGFFKSLLTKDSRIAGIEAFYKRIESVVNAFQISSLVNIEIMLSHDQAAAKEDKDLLEVHLNALEKNQIDLCKINHHNMIAMMVSIQRRLDNMSHWNDPERQFYSHTLQYLTSASGQQVELESWMIPSFEVDYGHEIVAEFIEGPGTEQTLPSKYCKPEPGLTLRRVLRKEIDIWLTLRHPNILQFLGANTLDDKPFIVMPYIPLNARRFLVQRPTFDPIYILRDISRGLEYLHSREICHGDLKGVNVLVDPSERALLCDFGLARVKADVTSRSNQQGTNGVMGSRNWMAPELLVGSGVRPPSDVYAFGMTIYELYTDENPMSEVAYWDFVEVVFRLDGRPNRPEPNDLPKLTDAVWSLAETCWAKDPKSRPSAHYIHDTITNLISVMPRDAGNLSTQKKTDDDGPILQLQPMAAPRSGEELHLEVERHRRTLGDDHPDTLTAMDNFARHCQPTRAQAIEEVVMELRKMVLGEDHPATLATMSFLAHTYYALEAKDIGVRAMEKQMVVLGKDHPDTLTTMGTLAQIYYDLEQYHHARDIGLVVTQELERILGPLNPQTLTSMNDLGRTINLQDGSQARSDVNIAIERDADAIWPIRLFKLITRARWTSKIGTRE
ncbi:kinase-like domain-containing protein [Mycena epipterygia]|nr:kinase-like domain-containing protein [Mycena epipterygia]